MQRAVNQLADSQKPGGVGLQVAAEAVQSACDSLIGSLDTKEMYAPESSSMTCIVDVHILLC